MSMNSITCPNCWKRFMVVWLRGGGPNLGRTQPSYCTAVSAYRITSSVFFPRPFLVVRVDHASQEGFFLWVGG